MAERMLGMAGQGGDAPLQAAMALHQDGRTAEAEAAYRAILAAAPDNADFRMPQCLRLRMAHVTSNT